MVMQYTHGESYRARRLALNGRKKKAFGRNMHYTLTPDEQLAFWWEGERIVTQDMNDLFTLTAGSAIYSMTVQRRIEKMVNVSDDMAYPIIRCYNDSSRHRNKLQPSRIRCYAQAGDWEHSSLPYTDGLLIQNRQILNPEICVDKVKRLSSLASATEIRGHMEPMQKLLLVMARMDAFDMQQVKERRPYGRKILETINIEDPTANDANTILSAGLSHWRTGKWFRLTKPLETENRKKIYSKASKLGLAKLRKELYERAGLYEYVPVTTTD